jgi:hypothetical protein
MTTGWQNALAIAAGLFIVQAHVHGQAGRSPAGPALNAKAAAPIELTGYWVSIVTEDWRFRMVTPAKGDYLSVPINMESKKIADAWDPAKDEAAGEQCKSYGAAAIMRLPERVHITWADDNTLRFDIDAGTQTRLLHFGNWKAAAGAPTWQGDSLAQWELQQTPPNTMGVPQPPAGPSKSGSLKVTTTHMRSGYLRKNGVPYSENAVLTEYYDVVRERDGALWLILTSVVRDPFYLQQPFIISTHFKKQSDGSGWDPSPCSARW